MINLFRLISDEENNRTKITEISLVACSAAHLQVTKMGDLPRVLHKLTLCINPFKRISYKAEELTGLNNDLLEHEQKFDKNTAETLSRFLFHLQKPCIIVAHNGLHFDFPVLKRMLEINDATLTEDLLVADSLLIFREIDDLEELLVAENSVRPLAPNPELLSKRNITDNVEDDEKALDNYICQELRNIAPEYRQSPPGLQTNSIEEPLTARQLRELNETTPVKQVYPTYYIRPQLNIRKESHSRLNEVTLPSFNNFSERFNLNNKRPRNSPPKSRRDLFGAKKPFKLAQIYERFFNELPQQSHYAEGDVITLLKCAIAKKEVFARVAQKQAIFFKDIKALGK